MSAQNWIRLEAADFSPDMPPFENTGSANIINALPKTPNSYGPVPSFAGYLNGTSLNLPCQGAYSCLDANDNVYIYAGDQKDLYQYTSASANPSVVSNGTHPYNCAADSMWRFAFFAGRVIATDFESPLQSFIAGSSTAFSNLAYGGITSLTLTGGTGYTNGTYALSVTGPGSGSGFTGTVTVSGGSLTGYTITSPGKIYPQTATISIPGGAGAGTGGSITPAIQTIAPNGRYIGIVKNFLCVGNTTDPVNGAQPQCVWWSAVNDPTNWPTVGTATAAQFQSSFNNLYGEGGQIQGIVGNLGTADGAVFMEHAVWSMSYAGPPDIFNFYPAEGVRGTPAAGSIVQLGEFVYYLGEDGFYVFNGTVSQPIGANRVDKYFFANANLEYLSQMVGCADPVNKMIYWGFSSGTNHEINNILGYNWQLDKWTLIQLSPNTVTYLFRAYTFGINVLDTVGAVSLDSSMYNTFPMDSRVWNGGQLGVGAFLWETNQLAFFNGPNLDATIETTEKQLFPGRRAQVKNVRPLIDLNTTGYDFSEGYSGFSVGYRDTIYVLEQYYNGANEMNYLGTVPQIVNGRYIRVQAQISGLDTWTEFQGVEIEATPSGAY